MNSLTSTQYQNLRKIRERKLKMYQGEDTLPYWFDDKEGRKLNVIFIRNMDEYLAGETALIETGMYRNWLQPNKIAVPATIENIQRSDTANVSKFQKKITTQYLDGSI